MFGDDRTQSAMLEQILKITVALATARKKDRLFRIVSSALRSLTGAEEARVHVFDRTHQDLHVEYAETDEGPRPVSRGAGKTPLIVDGKPNMAHICSYAAFSGKLTLVDDISKYAGFDFSDLVGPGAPAVRSVLAVPLRNHNETTIGVLQLLNIAAIENGALPPALEQVVAAFASQAAVALENVQLIHRNEELIEILNHTNAKLEEENAALRERVAAPYSFDNIVGQSAAMQDVYALMHKVLKTDATVLITGETGAGKELIASAIHYNGARKSKPFIAQNCAALPENLLESELFGYEKGAFTGADRAKKGLITEADGGALFLDEIGDMPLNLQSKLLRVLQEREVRPLGATASRKVNVRIIAATHCNLQAKIKEGAFREDLYYRLAVFPINLPPLRERKEDIPLLVRHFLAQAEASHGLPSADFSPAAMDALMRHDFPGNIRELRNIVERAVLMREADAPVMPEHLPAEIGGRIDVAASAIFRGGLVQVQTAPEYADGRPLKEQVGRFEAALIQAKLKELGGNKTKTAEVLGISRRSLIDKINRFSKAFEVT